MTDARDEVIDVLRRAGARFALLHGSRVAGTHRPDSDLDVAAWWPAAAPPSFEVLLPAGVDLVVLNDAPLELAGRIALDGQGAVRRRPARARPLDRDHPQDLRRRAAAAATQPSRVRRERAAWSMKSGFSGC